MHEIFSPLYSWEVLEAQLRLKKLAKLHSYAEESFLSRGISNLSLRDTVNCKAKGWR